MTQDNPTPADNEARKIAEGQQQQELRALYSALADLKAGKKVESGMESPLMTLIMHKLVANEEVKKPCRACGQPVHDYRYNRITAAGRLFMAVVEASSLLQETRHDG